MGYTTVTTVVSRMSEVGVELENEGLFQSLNVTFMMPFEGHVRLTFDQPEALARFLHELNTNETVKEYVKGITILPNRPESCDHKNYSRNPLDGGRCQDCGSPLDIFGNAIPTEGL